MILVFAAIIGIICALIANSKGRSAIGWFFIGFLLGLIGLIICIVMPNLKEQREKEEQMKMEQKRLEEQLRQERIKNERFQQYANQRLDVHDQTLNIDTKQLIPEESADIMRRIEGQQAETTEGTTNTTEVYTSEPSDSDDGTDALSEHRDGWYYHDNEKEHGPLSIQQIHQCIAKGIIQHSTHVWHRTFADWTPAGQVDFFDFGDTF